MNAREEWLWLAHPYRWKDSITNPRHECTRWGTFCHSRWWNRKSATLDGWFRVGNVMNDEDNDDRWAQISGGGAAVLLTCFSAEFFQTSLGNIELAPEPKGLPPKDEWLIITCGDVYQFASLLCYDFLICMGVSTGLINPLKISSSIRYIGRGRFGAGARGENA